MNRVHAALALVAIAAASCSNDGDEPGRARNVTATVLPAGGADQPFAAVHSRRGDAITYFRDGEGAYAQAVVQTAEGQRFRVHYAPGEAISSVVDETTGAFTRMEPRADGRGVVFLNFGEDGAFEEGLTVFLVGTRWHSAPVLGAAASFGQLTGNVTGSLSGSFALAPAASEDDGQFAYGPARPLNDFQQAVLANTARIAAAKGIRLLDLLVGRAYAQEAAGPNFRRMAGGVFLTIAGGLAFNAGLPVIGLGLIAVGVAQVGRELVDGVERTLEETFNPGAERAMRDALVRDMDDGVSPLTSLRRSAQTIADRGLGALAGARALVGQAVGLVEDVVLPGAAEEDLPPTSVPTADAAGGPLTGTLVDSSNRVYSLTGTLDADGGFVATGSSPGAPDVTLTGQADTGTATVTGGYVLTNAGGSTVGTGTIAGGTLGAMGQCQSTTQSGGNGTFSYAFQVGGAGGTFTLSYDMYSIPDAITVVLGGAVVYSSGGLVSGQGSVAVPASGGSTAFVNLSAPESGTAWTFTLGCTE